MAYETGQQLYHRVELEGRDKLTVSGVEDVERFDEGCIVMATCEGTLIVTGEGLHIGKLSLDGGDSDVVTITPRCQQLLPGHHDRQPPGHRHRPGDL